MHEAGDMAALKIAMLRRCSGGVSQDGIGVSRGKQTCGSCAGTKKPASGPAGVINDAPTLHECVANGSTAVNTPNTWKSQDLPDTVSEKSN